MMTKDQVKGCLLEEETVEVLENKFRSATTGTPFGNNADLWHKMKAKKQSGDLLHHFCTDIKSWREGEGRAGIALVRGGDVVYFFSTVHS